MLPLTVLISKEEKLLNQVTFNHDENYFILSNKDEPDVKLYIDYVLNPYDEYNPNEFSVILFRHDSIAENHIFEVYEKEINERIGWIFPIQSLQSKEHDYSKNIYFLKYAFVAFQKLLSNDCDFPFDPPECTKDERLKLDNLYGEDCVVLVLSNEQIKKITSFNIDYYLPYLYGKGYYKITNNNFKRQSYYYQETDYFKDIDKRLNIKRISRQLENYEFLILLFSDLLRFQSHELVKFHF